VTVNLDSVETHHCYRYAEDIVCDGQHHISFSSSLMTFFLPKVLFLLQEEPYFKTLVLLTQKTNADLIQPIISTRLPSAWPGTPFLKRALTSPFFPCNATIFPRTSCFPTGHATFRPMRCAAASLTDLMLGKRRMYSLGFWVFGPLRQLTMTPSPVLDMNIHFAFR